MGSIFIDPSPYTLTPQPLTKDLDLDGRPNLDWFSERHAAPRQPLINRGERRERERERGADRSSHSDPRVEPESCRSADVCHQREESLRMSGRHAVDGGPGHRTEPSQILTSLFPFSLCYGVMWLLGGSSSGVAQECQRVLEQGT